jgi:hypothetical protein
MCLDGAAFLVQPVKLLPRSRASSSGPGGKQAHAQVGFADAPAGVDARPEREAEVVAQSARGSAG